jgi:Protein of unknown function (DUF3667)
VWRTLPLLAFRPGKLTREWVQGKRARYVSPLALFLFTVFVMFMALSYLPAKPSEMTPSQRTAVAEAVRATSAQARVQLDREQIDPGKRAKLETALAAAGQRVSSNEPPGAAAGDWKAQLAARVESGELAINTGNPSLDEKIRHKLENPDLAIYKIQQTIYKFSFLLIPISIPFVALLFLWRRDVTLYDHGVFVLYSLTFMAALAMTAAMASRFTGPLPSFVLGATPLIVPAHMFAQLHGAYGLKWFSAAWRTLVLLVFCSIALLLFVLAIIWLGLT